MSQIPEVTCSQVAKFCRDYRYEVYQFTLPSVEPSAKSDVIRFRTVSRGIIVKLRVISDSDSLNMVLSSCEDMTDIRRQVLEMATDKKDFSYDFHNGDFMQFFMLDDKLGENYLYVQVENKGTVATGAICCTMILGD